MFQKLKRFKSYFTQFLERFFTRASEFTLAIAVSATVLTFIENKSDDSPVIVYYLLACAIAEFCGIIVRSKK